MNVALFPLSIVLASSASFLLGVWRGGRPNRPRRSPAADGNRFNDPVGERAVVVEPVTARVPGRVRFQATTWPARSLGESFRIGDLVAIAELDNITMVVERWQG